METWNRRELYAEVWEQPLVKVAAKYGISAVALGKVCRKLQIPLPGRGYWTKKEFGKPVERLPLPEANDVPIVHRLKHTGTEIISGPQGDPPEPEPTDPEFARIVAVESRTITVDPAAKRHKLVTATERVLKHAHADEKGILVRPHDQPCIEIRVSKQSLERALAIANALILALEDEGFSVSVEKEDYRHRTVAQIFSRWVPFDISEKLREKNRRQVAEYSWTRNVIEYEPKGVLQLRFGAWGQKYLDRKKEPLETQLSSFVGAMMREARSAMIREIEMQKEQRGRAALAHQIAEEEQRVHLLETWVTNWARAQQMRDFIAALEKLWREIGHDLSPEAPKGQRIIWMKQQADRLDPMVDSPPSILDRR